MPDYQRTNITTEWFNNTNKEIININCKTTNLLKTKEDAICYLLALNIYPKLKPKQTCYSWILENEETGYLIICGDNEYTIGKTEFKFKKEN